MIVVRSASLFRDQVAISVLVRPQPTQNSPSSRQVRTQGERIGGLDIACFFREAD